MKDFLYTEPKFITFFCSLLIFDRCLFLIYQPLKISFTI